MCHVLHEIYIEIATVRGARISTNYAVHQQLYTSKELSAFSIIKGFIYCDMTAESRNNLTQQIIHC
jgi:hypothetical protein